MKLGRRRVDGIAEIVHGPALVLKVKFVDVSGLNVTWREGVGVGGEASEGKCSAEGFTRGKVGWCAKRGEAKSIKRRTLDVVTTMSTCAFPHKSRAGAVCERTRGHVIIYV